MTHRDMKVSCEQFSHADICGSYSLVDESFGSSKDTRPMIGSLQRRILKAFWSKLSICPECGCPSPTCPKHIRSWGIIDCQWFYQVTSLLWPFPIIELGQSGKEPCEQTANSIHSGGHVWVSDRTQKPMRIFPASFTGPKGILHQPITNVLVILVVFNQFQTHLVPMQSHCQTSK